MDISQSIDSNLAVKTLYRDRLFFGNHEWCLHFFLDGASCLRYSGDDWQQCVNSVDRLWTSRRGVNVGGSWKLPDRISRPGCPDLIDLAGLLWKYRGRYKMVLHASWIYLYTNHLDLLQELERKPCIKQIYVTRAVVNRAQGVILRRQPTHSFRTFLRSRKYTESQKKCLQDWLSVQQNIKIGPGLRNWFDQSWLFWCRDYYWIDHDDKGILLMLEMILAGSIGRTQQIMAINKIQ